jgi:hypothetical protein
VAEALVRKRQRAAEAAVLFAGGWQIPLGTHLPESEGWVRLRLESGGGQVRLLAGSREVLASPLAGLSSVAYPAGERAVFALLAWGEDVEIREARWRALP